MSESFFLTKSVIDPGQIVEVGELAVIDQFETLRELLAARVGREAAELFAEPLVSRGNDTASTSISWYVPRAGKGQRLVDLDPDSRVNIETLLKSRLATLSTALADPDCGPLLGGALYLDPPDSVWVVAGRPFLVNWGLAPATAQTSQSERERHFEAGLGRFLPIALAPAISRDEWLAHGYKRDLDPPEAVGDIHSAAEPSEKADQPPTGEADDTRNGAIAGEALIGSSPNEPVQLQAQAEPSVWHWRWLAPILVLILFVALYFWLKSPGVLLYPPEDQEPLIQDESVVQAARDANRALEQRIADLRAAVDGAVCRPDGELVLPNGLTPFGLTPRSERPGGPMSPAQGPETARPDAASHLPPSNLVTPDPGGGDALVSLLGRIEDATVFVFALGGEASAHGTGFFITPELIVTNQHVVAPAMNGGRVLVTNERLQELTPVTVVADMGPLQTSGGDFAVLRIEASDVEPFTIYSPEGDLRGHQVIAAGYPAFVLETDSQFEALKRGNIDAIPGLVITDGIVSVEQKLGPETDVVVHTAHISSGNSGGPLIDACGRVAGINTFVRNEASSLNYLNFALSSDDLVRFLTKNGVTPSIVSDACTPTVLRQQQAVQPQTESAE